MADERKPVGTFFGTPVYVDDMADRVTFGETKYPAFDGYCDEHIEPFPLAKGCPGCIANEPMRDMVMIAEDCSDGPIGDVKAVTKPTYAVSTKSDPPRTGKTVTTTSWSDMLQSQPVREAMQWTEDANTEPVPMRNHAYQRAVEEQPLGCSEYEQTEATQLVADPMDRVVDGLTVSECLARYEVRQRESLMPYDDRYWDMKRDPHLFPKGRRDEGDPSWGPYERERNVPRGFRLNDAQLTAAKSAWSTALKRKQQEAREGERVSVVRERDEDGE